jgi:SAM-dependent methyltransferase
MEGSPPRIRSTNRRPSAAIPMKSFARAVNRILRRQGIVVRRRRYPQPRKSDVSLEERKALAAKIDAYVAANPQSSGPCSRATLETYLHYTRLAFYQNVVQLCREAGVEFADRDVADIGTGMGYLCRVIKRSFPTARVSGYDQCAVRLSFARALCEDVEFGTCDLMDVDGSFDVVLLMEVLEHLSEPEKAVQKLLSLVRPRGWVVITVPNGREDNYVGHINFWSPESWRHFIEINLSRDFQPTFASTRNGNNFVAIRRIAGSVGEAYGEAGAQVSSGSLPE